MLIAEKSKDSIDRHLMVIRTYTKRRFLMVIVMNSTVLRDVNSHAVFSTFFTFTVYLKSSIHQQIRVLTLPQNLWNLFSANNKIYSYIILCHFHCNCTWHLTWTMLWRITILYFSGFHGRKCSTCGLLGNDTECW